jgi:hypothetical protein
MLFFSSRFDRIAAFLHIIRQKIQFKVSDRCFKRSAKTWLYFSNPQKHTCQGTERKVTGICEKILKIIYAESHLSMLLTELSNVLRNYNLKLPFGRFDVKTFILLHSLLKYILGALSHELTFCMEFAIVF